ncbi:MAG: acetyl-CoA carboxylase, carboxyltransferase subunit beta [Eubacteriales bacterium]
MLPKNLFKKPQNILENGPKADAAHASIPGELCESCPSCGKTVFTGDLADNMNVCPSCGHYFRLNARQRILYTADEGTFEERDAELISANPLDFPEYAGKLERSKRDSSENEAVVCGTCCIGGHSAALFAMEPYFMMGSMGTVVGEKITRLFEYAMSERLPVIGYTVSGGARMQEGILSLMQMAKVSAAVKRHSDAGLLYVTVLTDPTMGGVTASFAMQGDIIIVEPDALVGFAGQRVIEQTIRQKLPQGFQRAEFLRDKGFADDIIERKNIKEYLTKVLYIHKGGAAK